MAEPAKTKRAIQRIMRDDQGRLAYILIDLDTMQPVRDPKDYRIINQFSSHVEEVTDIKKPDEPKSDKALARQAQTNKYEETRGRDRDSGNYTTSGRDGLRSSSSVRDSTVNRSGSTRSTGRVQPTRDAFSDPGTQLDAREKGFGSPTRTEQTRRSFVDIAPAYSPVEATGAPSVAQSGYVNQGEPLGGLKNNKGTRAPSDITGITVHHTGPDITTAKQSNKSTARGIVGVLNDRHLGAHYVIDRNGAVKEIASPETVVSHMKNSPKGFTNRNTIGIEVIGVENEDGLSNITDEQRKAASGLIGQLTAKYEGIGNNVYGHGALNAHKMDTEGITIADDWKDKGLAGIAPTPESKPTVAQQKVASVRDSLTPANNRQSQFTAEDLANFTPAQAAYYGYTKPTAEAKALAAKTLAGELSPQTREAAIAGDETALSHVGSILSVIDNRANSVMHNNAMSAITSPSMFSAFNPDNIKMTAANYSAVGPQVNGLVEQYYSQDPRMKPPSFNYTHYYNPQIANPTWGGLLKESTDLLDHRFGRLENEYKPNQTWRDSWQNAVKTQFQDYSGSSFANRPGVQANLDSPIEKSGARAGLDNMPGGSNYGGRHVGGAGSSPNSFAGGFSTQGGSKDPSAPGGRVDRGEKGWGGSSSGSTGGVKSDSSSYGGGPVDKGEKGWGGKSSSGGVKSDSHSAPGSSVDKNEKGW